MGASAGGVEALKAVVAGLPSDLPAAVVVVLHLPRSAPSALTAILARATDLPVSAAAEGQELQRGRIYVAPVDHHVLLVEGRTRLSRGPSENGHRPAIDPLFRSAAIAYGPRVIGVILSGSRDDGASGMAAIAGHGGLTVVQDPQEAPHPSMPNAAIHATHVDHVSPMAKIGPLLGELVNQPLPKGQTQAGDELLPADVATAQAPSEAHFSEEAGLGCPTCGGSLYKVEDSPIPRFRCRVGHAWSPESLLEEQSAALESALWIALRTLADKAALGRRMAADLPVSQFAGHDRFERIATDAETAADLIRNLIERIGANAAPEGRTDMSHRPEDLTAQADPGE